MAEICTCGPFRGNTKKKMKNTMEEYENLKNVCKALRNQINSPNASGCNTIVPDQLYECAGGSCGGTVAMKGGQGRCWTCFFFSEFHSFGLYSHYHWFYHIALTLLPVLVFFFVLAAACGVTVPVPVHSRGGGHGGGSGGGAFWGGGYRGGVVVTYWGGGDGSGCDGVSGGCDGGGGGGCGGC
jgi:hypothetical protein